LSPLRERKDDIHLLYRKFASDFASKYKMPTVRLDQEAQKVLENCHWPGNIRQLRNVAEQISVLEKERELSPSRLREYLPKTSNLPSVIKNQKAKDDFSNEREILYKVLFDMKSDLNDLKKLTLELLSNGNTEKVKNEQENLIKKIYGQTKESRSNEDDFDERLEVLQIPEKGSSKIEDTEEEIEIDNETTFDFAEDIEEEETLSLQEKEIELIKKSLDRYNGKRKPAAEELGISERTLYRKIKQYDL
jgi:DNA-binding NtrC family response regulator